jgi:RNA polymerase sigma-70 factor (ECF subfamily)
MCTAPDEQLITQAQNGDHAAFTELIQRYERKTYHIAFRIMGNHPDAADAAQEALVRVYTRLHNFRGDSLFSTWLFRVVTNTCLDQLRRRGRLRCGSLEASLPLDGPSNKPLQTLDVDDGPIDWAERHEVQAAVQRAIAKLPEEYRTVVIMRDLQEYTYHEIAEMLQTSLGTVKSRLHRARLALRVLLKRTESNRLGLTG